MTAARARTNIVSGCARRPVQLDGPEQRLGSVGPSEAKVFRHAPVRVACENLVCALKLLGGLHAGRDNPVEHDFRRSAGAKEASPSRMK